MERGATIIKVIPVLLLTAVHAKKDIPEKLLQLKETYPSVEVRYGRPIGVHPYMIEILSEHFFNSSDSLNPDTMVILVGRGSSDPDVKRDLGTIAEMLRKRLNLKRVSDCYLTGVGPSFEQVLYDAKESGIKEIFIIPYLLFTGILMNSLKRKITYMFSDSDTNPVLCHYLGYHPSIELILKDRVLELEQRGK